MKYSASVFIGLLLTAKALYPDEPSNTIDTSELSICTITGLAPYVIDPFAPAYRMASKETLLKRLSKGPSFKDFAEVTNLHEKIGNRAYPVPAIKRIISNAVWEYLSHRLYRDQIRMYVYTYVTEAVLQEHPHILQELAEEQYYVPSERLKNLFAHTS